VVLPAAAAAGGEMLGGVADDTMAMEAAPEATATTATAVTADHDDAELLGSLEEAAA
jgi:hypothetical protein